MVEQRKREQLEKLEKADAEGKKLGGTYGGSKNRLSKTGNADGKENKTISLEDLKNGTTDGTTKPVDNSGGTDSGNPVKPPAPPSSKPGTNPKPPAVKPTPKEGTRRKGKKGDG
jgi:hypothetical protein